MEQQSVGIDWARPSFTSLVSTTQERCWCGRSSRVPGFFALPRNTQVALIGMEACAGSHFMGRALRGQGHEVRLMPATLPLALFPNFPSTAW